MSVPLRLAASSCSALLPSGPTSAFGASALVVVLRESSASDDAPAPELPPRVRSLGHRVGLGFCLLIRLLPPGSAGIAFVAGRPFAGLIAPRRCCIVFQRSSCDARRLPAPGASPSKSAASTPGCSFAPGLPFGLGLQLSSIAAIFSNSSIDGSSVTSFRPKRSRNSFVVL